MMGRLRHIALTVSVLAVAAWFAVSCNSDNPAYPRENLKATWIVYMQDGNVLDERDWHVMTFNSSGMVYWAGVLTLGESGFQWGENTLYYDIYCCDLSVYGSFEGLYGHLTPVETEQEYYFIDNRDSSMTLGVESWKIGGAETVPEFTQMTMRKLPSTYAEVDTIAGVWQFNTLDGADFSGYRIQFQSDGTLVMSSRSGENSWIPMGGGEDYFRLYDDFLTLTVYDNSAFGTPAKWDVKCFQIDSISSATGSMAMHSSGQSYTLSFISPN